jgi:hypothetical protein
MSDWEAHIGPQRLERFRVTISEVCDLQCIVIKLLETITVHHEDLASLQKVKISSVVQRLVKPGPEGDDFEATIEVSIDYSYQPVVF